MPIFYRLCLALLSLLVACGPALPVGTYGVTVDTDETLCAPAPVGAVWRVTAAGADYQARIDNGLTLAGRQEEDAYDRQVITLAGTATVAGDACSVEHRVRATLLPESGGFTGTLEDATVDCGGAYCGLNVAIRGKKR
jgi:hypothetical protein